MMAAVASFAPAKAIAQSLSRNPNRVSGINGLGGMSSGMSASSRMGSSGGMGASSQGGGIGRSSGASGFGSGSGGFGQRGAGGSAMGSGGSGGSGAGGSQSLGSRTGSSGSRSGSSGHKAPKLKLKPASEAAADSASHSMYDYSYGAEDTGRNADSIYKSKDEAAPTDNYKFGATDPR
jgi:hypothetical protein